VVRSGLYTMHVMWHLSSLCWDINWFKNTQDDSVAACSSLRMLGVPNPDTGSHPLAV